MTRDLIRVQRSILNAEDLKRLVSAAYNFTGGVHCRLIKAMMADTYNVWADNQRFVLRVYRHGARTYEEIEAEVRLVTYLHEMGLIVPLPMTVGGRNGNGSAILKLTAPEGERYGVLFRYIEGTSLGYGLKPQTAAAFGGTLAQLHRTLDKLTLTFDRPLLDADALLKEPMRALKTAGLLAHRARDLAYLHRITSVLRTKMTDLPPMKPGFGLIHGDVDSSNVVMMHDGRVGLLDFDFIGEGYRVYDLAAFQSDAHFQRVPEVVFEAFLEGYSAIRPITDAELEALPLFRAARAVWAMGLYALHVDEWGSLRFSEALIDRHLDGIRAAMVEMQIGRA